MPRRLISEQDILDVAKRGERTVHLDENVIVTDAAKDRAKQLGIKFGKKNSAVEIQKSPPSSAQQYSGPKEVLAIGSDHGGFQLKELLKPFLESLRYQIVDLGTYSNEACDYPDYAYAVARMVSLGEASKGIMIDSVGIASDRKSVV